MLQLLLCNAKPCTAELRSCACACWPYIDALNVTSPNDAVQLQDNTTVCLKPVLCAVAEVATQLQRLQIVTQLLDMAPPIRVKDLVWQLPESPMPPVV